MRIFMDRLSPNLNVLKSIHTLEPKVSYFWYRAYKDYLTFCVGVTVTRYIYMHRVTLS